MCDICSIVVCVNFFKCTYTFRTIVERVICAGSFISSHSVANSFSASSITFIVHICLDDSLFTNRDTKYFLDAVLIWLSFTDLFSSGGSKCFLIKWNFSSILNVDDCFCFNSVHFRSDLDVVCYVYVSVCLDTDLFIGAFALYFGFTSTFFCKST